jgi:hypothetical protein
MKPKIGGILNQDYGTDAAIFKDPVAKSTTVYDPKK